VAAFKTLDDLPPDLTGKRVLVRVDLNVPMEGASVSDDTRLRALLPTVLELVDRGAIVLLLSHFGRPKGQNRPDMSTAQLVRPLTLLSGRSVRFIEDCQGPEAERGVMVKAALGSKRRAPRRPMRVPPFTFFSRRPVGWSASMYPPSWL
jgi:phosphoglycerate kinase